MSSLILKCFFTDIEPKACSWNYSALFFCTIIPYDFVWKDITTIWDSISLLLDTIDFHGLRWYWIRYTKKRIDKFTSGSCSCTLRLAFGIQRWRRWRTRWRSRCWGRCRLSCRSCSPSRTLASPVLIWEWPVLCGKNSCCNSDNYGLTKYKSRF